METLREELSDVASKKLIRFLEQDPNNAKAWRLLGGGEFHGRYYSQLDCFKKSLELNDKDSQTWFDAANTRFIGDPPVTINGKTYTPLQLSEHAVEVNPKSSDAWAELWYYHGGVVNGQHYSRSQTAWKALFAPQHRLVVNSYSLYYLCQGVVALFMIASIIHCCFFAAIRPVSKRKKKKMMYKPMQTIEKDEI